MRWRKSLTNLPRFTAYAKIIEEKDGEQKVKTAKIQTYPLPKILETAEEDLAMAIENGYVRSKKRSEIEVEIRERQEKWRVVAAQTAKRNHRQPHSHRRRVTSLLQVAID